MREITDRREEYYAKSAELIAADPLAFYARAERGREIQAAIKPRDYETPKPGIRTIAEIMKASLGCVVHITRKARK